MPSLIKPALPPESEDPREILAWALQEFERLGNVVSDIADGRVAVLNAAPAKPRDGMIRMADGTNWNPGSGKGYYGYKAGTGWVFLG